MQKGTLQLSLLDEKNLAEITSPDYPGERLVVCHNPRLEEERARKRQALLEATEKSLTKIAKEVARRKKTPLQAAEIGLKVGKVLGRYKVGKHFDCRIGEGSFEWSRRQNSIAQEEKLDGIYVLRTREPAARLSAEDTVRSFAALLAELASRARVTYEFKSEELKLTCQQVPEPTPLQARAYELIRAFPVTGN